VTLISRHASNPFASTTYPRHQPWNTVRCSGKEVTGNILEGKNSIICSVPSKSWGFFCEPPPHLPPFPTPTTRNNKLRLAGSLLDLPDQTVLMKICCPIIDLLVLYKHYGLHNLPFWESWPFSENRQMWMSVITLHPSAMTRKPFRIVLIALLANQIRNLFYKHRVKWRTEESTHELVKNQKNNAMLRQSSEIKVLKMINQSNVKFWKRNITVTLLTAVMSYYYRETFGSGPVCQSV
jgi:hypothetical protein